MYHFESPQEYDEILNDNQLEEWIGSDFIDELTLKNVYIDNLIKVEIVV